MDIPVFTRSKNKQEPKQRLNFITMFANQKGGVGKSTLCLSYATYLTEVKGIRLVVIDADPQHSTYRKWKQDCDDHPNAKPLYNVVTFDDLDNEQETIDFIKDLRKQDYSFIIDTPGNMGLAGLIHLAHAVDVIATPVQYEKLCARSTNAFINFVLDLCDKVSPNELKKIAFIPNMHQKRWGNKEESIFVKQTEEDYSNIGLLLPRIPLSPEMRRLSIYGLTNKQKEIVGPCFEKLCDFTYNQQQSDK